MSELSDFVNSFQAGYNLIKSKDEREWEKEEREMKRADHARQRERDARSDMEWDEGNRYRWDRATVGDSQWERQFGFNERKHSDDQIYRGNALEGQSQDRAIRIEELKRRRADGYSDEDYGRSGDVDEYLQSPPVIPDPISYRGGAQAINLADAGARTAQSTSGFNLASYLQHTRSSESGGDDRARNKRSTATGRYQFLEGTWNDLARKYPELGLTPEGRYDSGQQERAMQRFTYDNGKALQRAGVPVTNGTMYAAHFLGSGDAVKVLRAGDNTPVARLVSPRVVAANPFLRNMDVGSFRSWAERKGGGQRRQRGAVNVARGGLVEPMEDEDEPGFTLPPEEAQASEGVLPEETPRPMPRPEYAGGMEGQEEAPTDDPFEQGRRAARDGLNRAIKQLGLDMNSPIDDPETQRKREHYLRGYGAGDPQILKQVMDTIDPERKLPSGERNVRALGTVYQYYRDRGEYDKAEASAMQMTQAMRYMAEQQWSLAAAAAERGDLDNAARAAVAAYDHIPNGLDLKVDKTDSGNYRVSVTDERTGNVIERNMYTPENLAQLAMGFGPGDFDKQLLVAAGGSPAQLGETTSTVREATSEGARTTIDEIYPEGENELVDRFRGPLTDIAGYISSIDDNNMASAEAARLVTGILENVRVDRNENGEPVFKAPFTSDRDPTKNYVEVKHGGRIVRVSPDVFERLEGMIDQRASELQEQVAREDRNAGSNAAVMDALGKGIDVIGNAFSGAGAIPDEQGGQIDMFQNPASGGLRPVSEPEPQEEKSEIQELLEAREQVRNRRGASQQQLLSRIEERLRELGYEE